MLTFFLSIYPRQNIEVPLGWDTSRYLWQTTLVQEDGLSALGERLPIPFRPSLSRPAFPVTASSLSSLMGISPIRLAWVLPTVLAAIVALAAGAFVTTSLRRPLWELLFVVAAVGTSSYVARLLAPEAYQDNLAAAALLIVAAIPLAHVVAGEARAALTAVAILAVAGITHWVFFLFFAGALALTAAMYAPVSWRRWRAGEPLWTTPAARLGMVLGGAGAVAAAAIYGLLGAGPERPKLSGFEFRKKFREDLPLYRFPVLLPLALAGVASIARPGRPAAGSGGDGLGPGEAAARERARFVRNLLVAWTAVAALGVVAFLGGMRLPAHRFLAFALSVPILAAIALTAGIRLVVRRGPGPGWVLRVAAGVVAAGVVAASAYLSHRAWSDQPSWARMDRPKVEQAATAAAYLDRIAYPDERPLVFVVDDRGPNPDAYVGLMSDMIRVALPASRMDDAYLYVGTPENFLAGVQTFSDTSEFYAGVSTRYFETVRPLMEDDPVAFVTSAYNDDAWPEWIAANPRSRVGPDVAVVSGGPTDVEVATPPLPLGEIAPTKLAALAAATIAAFGIAGLGWALAAFRRRLRPFELLAVAPALGIGGIVGVGVVADRLGIRLHGVGGAAVVLVAAALGYLAAWRATRVTRGGLRAGS